jgi:AraC-like DNA-binding protein
MEIYAKFKQNPVDSTFVKLAQEYRMSLTRCKAVIYLMRTREEMMASNGVLNIPESWQRIYDAHKQHTQRLQEVEAVKKQIAARDEAAAAKAKKKQKKEAASGTAPAAPATTAPSTDGGAGSSSSADPLAERLQQLEAATPWTPEALAAEHKLSVEEVSKIIAKMADHALRSANLSAGAADMEARLAEFREAGVNTAFRETSDESDTEFDRKYFPRLFRDDEWEEETRRQRAALLIATRARADPSVTDIMGKRYDNTSSVATAPVGNAAGVPTSQFMRSKLAFIDISNEATSSGATLVRTRSGSQRVATPLEEMHRSWGGRKPTYLDLALNEKLVAVHQDPDKDEARARAAAEKRYAAHKAAAASDDKKKK